MIWVFPQYLRLFPDQFFFHLPFYGIMTIVTSRNIGQNPPIVSRLILPEKQ